MQRGPLGIILAIALILSVTFVFVDNAFAEEKIKPKKVEKKPIKKTEKLIPETIKKTEKKQSTSLSDALAKASDGHKKTMTLAPHCTSPISGCLDLRVGHIEVTQGIQDMQNSIFLVSRKDTFVRVYVEKNTNEPISGVTGILEVCKKKGSDWRSCQKIHPYDGPKTIQLNSIEDQRRFADQTINFKISGEGDYLKEGPKLRIKAMINPEANGKRAINEIKYENNQDTEIVDLVRAHSLHIDFHPDKFGQSWCDKPSTAFFVEQLRGYAMKIFPSRQTINDMGTDSHSLKYSGGKEGPRLSGSGIGVITELQGHKDPTATQGWPLEVALFCKNPPPRYGNMGMGWNEAAWAYGQSSGSNTILAHEIAHAIGLGHVPIYPKEEPRYYDEHYKIDDVTRYVKHIKSINPKTGEESTATIKCRDSKDLHVKGMGELLEDDNYPRYDKKYGLRASIGEVGFDGVNVMHPEVYTDVMAYCDVEPGSTFMGQQLVHGGNWISPYHYAKLFNDQIVYDKGDKKLANGVINKQPK